MSSPPLPTSISFESAVFEVALTLDSTERREFLDHIFQSDPTARARMEALLGNVGECSAYFLGASEETGALAAEILEQMPDGEVEVPETLAPIEEIGSCIGDYRILSRIGEGGCGVVYEAEQQKPVRRNVALKIIRLGMDTERVIARFEAERQALALMDHPNIARVFDAGATASGRPYFVMERVAGERITTYCDREKLDLVTRIKLFIQVCQAIQYAHQKSVVHRDIKPSNILVTSFDGAPVPKVIDFGIAKAASDPSVDLERSLTGLDQLMGTPAYMSPEQVDMSGTDVDTRSDIYSLGGLLYELLGGRPAFDKEVLAKVGMSRLRKILLEEEPPILSRMLAETSPEQLAAIAAARREEPVRLVSRLRGDLDRIVAKAMAKDRNLRYQTANALAADLGRFLAHEPVLARRPSRLYLTGKFIRRNRMACISAFAVAVSLLIGFGTSTWLYLREHRALAEQQRLRAQAQARANVSQAAVMVSEGKIKEADALLQEETLESIEPSREAAGVFREIGNWNAFYGKWDRAVQCYTLLSQANRLDGPASVVEKCEVLAIASAFLANGNRSAYERYRREMLDLYLPARNPFQAEHLLQAALLTPAGPDITDRLRDAAKMRYDPGDRFCDWEAFALTLYYHRLGKAKETLGWGKQCLSYPVSAESLSGNARSAAALCLTAIAHHRLGDERAAREDLRRARELCDESTRSGLGDQPSLAGVWYSWVIARLLMREAESEIVRAVSLRGDFWGSDRLRHA